MYHKFVPQIWDLISLDQHQVPYHNICENTCQFNKDSAEKSSICAKSVNNDYGTFKCK